MQIDQENSLRPIDYTTVNEEFDGDSISGKFTHNFIIFTSDEEDEIEKTLQQKTERTKTKANSRYERAIRVGIVAQNQANLGFPNYFIAQKLRAQVSKDDEKFGNENLLKKSESKKSKSVKKSHHKSDRRQARNETTYVDDNKQNSSDNEEVTVYKKQGETEIKWEDIKGDEKVPDKHFE